MEEEDRFLLDLHEYCLFHFHDKIDSLINTLLFILKKHVYLYSLMSLVVLFLICLVFVFSGKCGTFQESEIKSPTGSKLNNK